MNEPLVISERFFHTFCGAGLTGIGSFSEIEVVRVGNKTGALFAPPNYYLAEVKFTGSVKLDVNNTIIYGQKREWTCPACNPFGRTCDRIERLELDTAQWDGSDIFRIYTGQTIWSLRFYEFVHINQFTNFDTILQLKVHFVTVRKM